MAEENTTIEAEVSVRNNGSVYLGVKSREMLGVGYNDNVSITFEGEGPSGSDITVSGSLDSSSNIYIGKELCNKLGDSYDVGIGTKHINAIVEKADGSWYDDKERTERRWKKVFHLAAEVLP